jgi:hypothetical protein
VRSGYRAATHYEGTIVPGQNLSHTYDGTQNPLNNNLLIILTKKIVTLELGQNILGFVPTLSQPIPCDYKELYHIGTEDRVLIYY